MLTLRYLEWIFLVHGSEPLEAIERCIEGSLQPPWKPPKNDGSIRPLGRLRLRDLPYILT